MATEVITTVIPGGGGDYTLLSSWESGEQRDLVSADEIAVAECQSGQISDTCRTLGWTTDLTRSVHIRPASGHEHGGDRTAGFRITNGTAAPIRPDQLGARVEGIVVLPTSDVDGITHVLTNGAAFIYSCVVYGGGSGDGAGIEMAGNGSTHRCWNNIVYGFEGATFGRGILCATNGTAYFYNNTLVDCRQGIVRTGGTCVVKNNIAQSCTDADFAGVFTDTATNISSDTTSPEVGLQSITLDFVDAANGDFHLDTGDTEAIGAGTDLSADANLAFSDDIDGDARPAGDWDIGADQTAAADANELSGTPSAQPADASGTLTAVASTSGTPSATTATADGAMQHVSPVAGTPQAALATADGALQALIQLSGAPTAERAAAAGTLAALISMAGAAAAERASSAGTVGVVVSMSGAVQASNAEVFGGLIDDGTGPSPDGFFGSDEWWI